MTDVTDKPGAGLTEADLAALVDEVGAADVVLDPSAMEAYRWDWSRFRRRDAVRCRPPA